MEWYVDWVRQNALLSAAVQFAVLGTLGEVVSHLVKTRRIELPFGLVALVLKMAAWALLGVLVKYGFAGVQFALLGLIGHGYLPAALAPAHVTAAVADRLPWALTMSVTVNAFFGPQLMAFHRLEDNLIDRRWDFSGIQKAWATLLWFWIPAHTVTFILPEEYRIGLAAAWGFVLGLILGLSAPARKR